MKKKYLSPLFVFLLSWFLVVFLYKLKISGLFVFEDVKILYILNVVLLPFTVFYFMTGLVILSMRRFKLNYSLPEPLYLSKKNVIKLFYIWFFVTLIEIGVSGGIPLIWYLTGSNKTYFDFGIGGLHGLMNAYLLAISSYSFISYIKTKEKFYFYCSFFIVFWGLIVIARQIIVVYLIQIFFIYANHATNKVLAKKLLFIIVVALLSIIVFGIVGDFRNGREVIMSVSSLNIDYPDWLPSGFLWVYMYLTTPLNNLINAFYNFIPNYDLTFPNTFSSLFPSFIRNLIFSPVDAFSRPWLYVKSFTVSTAFISPYVDFGIIGVLSYSSILGVISSLVWNSRRKDTIYLVAIVLQCLSLSIFVNHFLYLPVIFQFFFSALFVRYFKYES